MRTAWIAVLLFAAAAPAAAQGSIESRVRALVESHAAEVSRPGGVIDDCLKEGFTSFEVTNRGLDLVCYRVRYNRYALGDIPVIEESYTIGQEELAKHGFAVVEDKEREFYPMYWRLIGKCLGHLIDRKAATPSTAIVSQETVAAAVGPVLDRLKEQARAKIAQRKSQDLSDRIKAQLK